MYTRSTATWGQLGKEARMENRWKEELIDLFSVRKM
jgi:hypothetical protein